MKKCMLFGLLLAALAGCKNEKPEPRPDPSRPARLILERGDQQTGFYGAFLPDSLVLRVEGPASPNYSVSYKVRIGNGFVQPANYSPFVLDVVQPDAKGRVRARWSLGCNALQQKVTVYLHDATAGSTGGPPVSPPVIDSLSLTATAQKPTGWSRACGGSTPIVQAREFCNCAGGLYAVLNGRPYTSADEGVNWRPLAVPVANDDVQFLRCNSRGTLYALLRTNGVYTSTNQGASWTAINNGILDHRYPLTMLVEDDAVFVSFLFDGLYRTTTNGSFWRKLLLDGKYYEEYSFLTRHPNGDLYVFDKWSALFKSSDNGGNWQKQPPAYSYISSPAYDMAVDNAGKLVVASGYDGYVATLSPATLTGSVTSFYTPQTHTTCQISQLTPFQNRMYFLVQGNLTPGVYAGTPGSYALATANFPRSVQAFHVRADGSLLLASSDGLYYFAR